MQVRAAKMKPTRPGRSRKLLRSSVVAEAVACWRVVAMWVTWVGRRRLRARCVAGQCCCEFIGSSDVRTKERVGTAIFLQPRDK
jgi:hypothetical protein